MGATWCGGVTAGDCNCNRAVVGGRVYIHTHTICFPFEKQSKCCGRGCTYEEEGYIGVVGGGREEERRIYRGGREGERRISRGGRDPSGRIYRGCCWWKGSFRKDIGVLCFYLNREPRYLITEHPDIYKQRTPI
jgi:hypothetical protein